MCNWLCQTLYNRANFGSSALERVGELWRWLHVYWKRREFLHSWVPVAADCVAWKLPRKLITCFFRIYIWRCLHSRWVTYASCNLDDRALKTATNAALIWSFVTNGQVNGLWAFTALMRCAITDDNLSNVNKKTTLGQKLPFLDKNGFSELQLTKLFTKLRKTSLLQESKIFASNWSLIWSKITESL